MRSLKLAGRGLLAFASLILFAVRCRPSFCRHTRFQCHKTYPQNAIIICASPVMVALRQRGSHNGDHGVVSIINIHLMGGGNGAPRVGIGRDHFFFLSSKF